MSKTYTYNLTFEEYGSTAHTGSTYYNYGTNSTGTIGRKDSIYYQLDLNCSATLPATSNITSATVTLTTGSHGTSSSGLYYNVYALGTDDKANTNYSSRFYLICNAPDATVSIDVSSHVKAGYQNFRIRNYANISVGTGWVQLTKAVLTVVTNETDYILSYDANNGAGAPSSQTKAGTTSATFTISATTPSRTGYAFAGWATSASATSAAYQAGGSITVSANTTLYAVWTPNTYKVTFNANGGAVSQSSKNVTHDSTYGALPTPTRAGYNFLGWYTDATSGSKIISSTKVTITAAQTLYAHWEKATIKVTLKFGWDDGANDVTFETNIGEEYSLNPYDYSSLLDNYGRYNSYNFRGWAKNPNMTGTSLTNAYINSEVWDEYYGGFYNGSIPTAGETDEIWYAAWSAPGNIYIKTNEEETKGVFNGLRQCVPFCNNQRALDAVDIRRTIVEGIGIVTDGAIPTPPPLGSYQNYQVYPQFWFTND